ncbi:hypothetical protein MKZ38_002314 [Zalerion maritima]|uniref:Uncharacterized protein n=1 Tax=Zalerion maritima TaxID=339359 RepID=A0AAD5RQM0_9PEZI|nr:hypothetical protein MKZ38_002314 [Zalerion maritima]
MASLASSPESSPPGSSTASPTSSPESSPPGSPTLVPSLPIPNIPVSGPSPAPTAPQYGHPQPLPYANATPHIPPIGVPLNRLPPFTHTKYAHINTPYDLLVSYEYFSEPQGFKPYHFRQCYMPTSCIYVIVEKAWSTQVDLDTYSQILLRYHPDCYTDLRYKCVSDSPAVVRRPKVQVCPLYSSEMQRAIDRAVDPELEREDPKLFARLKHLSDVEDKIVFFIVVQGKGQGPVSKLVVKASFYQIMTEMFSAAANQLSIVFSGAMREKDLGRLGKGYKNSCQKALRMERRTLCHWEYVRSDTRFKRVDNYDDLLVDDLDKNVIRVGC